MSGTISSAGAGYPATAHVSDPVEITPSLAAGGRPPLRAASPVQLPDLGLQAPASSGLNSKPVLPLPDAGIVPLDLANLDGDLIVAFMGLERGKASADAAENDIKANQKEQKKLFEKRSAEIEKANKAAEEAKAKENSFWGKLGKVLSVVGSIVAVVASVALTAAMVASGVGLAAGVLLIAMTASSVASTTMDVLVSTGAMKDPGWRPTISGGVQKGLTALGVNPTTAAFIGMGVELVANIATGRAVINGVKAAGQKALTKGGEAFAKLTSKQASVMKASTYTEAGGGAVSAIGGAATSAVNISVAASEWEADMANAKAEEIRALMTRLSRTMQMDMDTLKAAMQQIQESFEMATDIVVNSAESSKAVAANLGGGATAA